MAREIRYSGLQVIRGEGYTLHPGLLTWEHRAGVCKDIAGMLVTMMRAAGFPHTWPAMTMAGARVEDVPADQFNHCVVAWERTDGDYVMLDPTWAPWSRHPWSLAESEQQFLVGAPLGDVLRTTPALEPSENRLEITLESRLRKDGTLESKVEVRTTGYLETALRRGLVGTDVAGRGLVLREIARDLSPAARITRTRQRPTDLEDLDAPLVLELSTEIPGWAAPVEGAPLAFVPPSFHHPVRHQRLWENLLVTGAAKRSRGLSFSCPKEIVIREELRLPGRYRLVSPTTGTSVTTPLGTASWTLRIEGGDRLVTEQRASFSTRRVGVEQLKDYERLVAPLQALETLPVLLAPQEDR
ncbi:MAG: transglutaminase domain-containing protein [Pseudomonadota bacterium]